MYERHTYGTPERKFTTALPIGVMLSINGGNRCLPAARGRFERRRPSDRRCPSEALRGHFAIAAGPAKPLGGVASPSTYPQAQFVPNRSSIFRNWTFSC